MEPLQNRNIKDAKTFEEQLQILQGRGVLITDYELALSILQRINYYRLTSYGLTLKQSTNPDMYIKGTTFLHFVSLYEFDKKLRQLLLGGLESIEIAFRTHIAYHHAHKYSPLGYTNPSNFKNAAHHHNFSNNFERLLTENKNELFIIHHKSKYNNNFPFWVAIEILSFSTLSKLYKNLLNEDKTFIAKSYYNVSSAYIESWLHTLTTIRNICAHHGRLYGKKLSIRPKLFDSLKKKIKSDSLFAAIFVLLKLLNETNKSTLLISLQALLEEYEEYVSLVDIGFPQNWVTILSNSKF